MTDDTTDPGFEHDLLQRAAQTVAWPATPDLAGRVRTQITSDRMPGRGAHRWRLVLGALTAIVLVTVTVAVATPAGREAVADLFRIEIDGERVERLASPAAGPSTTPVALDARAIPATLEEARAHLDRPIILPPDDEPEAVYLVDYDGAPGVVVQFAGYDLWQTAYNGGYFGKSVPPATLVDDLTVGGAPALWIAGGTRIVSFVDEDGQIVNGSVRATDRNTLAWTRDGIVWRIEGDMSLPEALHIAASME